MVPVRSTTPPKVSPPTVQPGRPAAAASDILSTPQVFQGGIVTATANLAQNVWNDLSPPFAGLGVGLASQGSDADQISGSDVLHIHFASDVRLTGVATLFDPTHSPFGTLPAGSITAAMTFLLNGVVTTFGAANMALLSLVGHDFDFQQNGSYQPGFYVSALTFTAVPVPGAVWLFAQRHRRHRGAYATAQKKSVRNRSLIKDV